MIYNSQKRRSLACALSEVVHEVGDRKLIADVSEAVVRTIPPAHSNRQILVDISELISGSRKFGSRSGYMKMLRKWLTETGGKERIEPISAMEGRGYQYARQWTLDLLDVSISMLKDDPIESQIGDIFIGFGLPTQMLPTRFFHYLEMRRRGIRAYFLIDELPLAEATSEADLDGSSGKHGGIEFLHHADCVIFGSRLIANRIKAQLVAGGVGEPVRPSIAWIHDEPTDFDTDDLVNLFESPKSLMEFVRTQSVTRDN